MAKVAKKAGSIARKDAPQRTRKPKQAVIVVHGMGEQRPMETLRSFVAALCGVNPVEAERGSEPFHIIPDSATGSGELARVRVSTPPDGFASSYVYQSPTMRTDFYEFYFADLLGGTTFSNLRVWAQSVMLRWPHQVPRALAGLWATLWAVLLLLAAYIGTELDGDVWSRLTGFLTSGLKPDAPGPTPLQCWMLGLAAAGLAWQMVNVAIKHVQDPATKPPKDKTLAPWVSYIAAVAVPAGLAFAAYHVLPWKDLTWSPPSCASGTSWQCGLYTGWSFVNQAWIKLVVAAFVWWGATKFGVSYFGDVARYLHMSPDAVAARAAVRDRGMKLFSDLAGKRWVSGSVTSDIPDYDRIIVVAHSLGSVVAYDVLRLLWARDNANANQALPKDALEAMRALDDLAKVHLGKADVPLDSREKLIGLQKKVSESLAKEKQGWRFSDFITLGSPLARGDFLLARDWPHFRQSADERSLPLCPPLLEGINDSFLYSGGTVAGYAPHHAAMFSAVRWTAVYDPYRYPMNGDFIGGPVSGLYGWGAIEAPATIRRKGSLLSGLFTHTDYWNPKVSANFVNVAELPFDIRRAEIDEQSVIGLLRRLIWPEALDADKSNGPVKQKP